MHFVLKLCKLKLLVYLLANISTSYSNRGLLNNLVAMNVDMLSCAT